MNYSELQLDSRLNSNIQLLNYTEMTPIQAQAIPLILQGRDVAGLAQTGTGKTAAFLIPLIERILKAETQPENEVAFKDWKPFNSILVLVPTRELAEQIHENALKFIAGTGLKSFPFYGGTGYEKQKEALKNGVNFMISTPGRLIDLYKEHHVDFKRVRAVVFDEADRMFDMGFKEDMKYVLGRIERNRQFLVFSATLNFDVLNTAYQFGAEPVEINVSRDQAKAEHVQDAIFHIGDSEKPQQLLSLLKKENPKQTIVFTNFKNNVDRVAQFLTSNGIPANGISSLMSQAQRNLVLEQFKAENDRNVLVATDVAARGLDILGVDLVVNFEMPQDPESYVHRIGRTGRAGQDGKAFSFISDKDVESLSRVEEYTKKKITVAYFEDADLVKDFKPISSHSTFRDRDFSSKDKPQGRGPQRDGRGGPQRSGSGPQRGPSRNATEPRQGGHANGASSRGDFKKGPSTGQDKNFDRGPKSPSSSQQGPQKFDRANGPRKFDKSAAHKNPGHSQNGQHKNGAAVLAVKPTEQKSYRTHRKFKSNSTSNLTNKKPATSGNLVSRVKSFFKRLLD